MASDGKLEGFSKQRGKKERQQVSVGEILKTLGCFQYGGILILIFRGFRRRTQRNVRFG